jgi:ABC-2 type transport system permease protein
MRAALVAEATKFLRARVPIVTTIMLTAGIGLLCASMLFAVHAADADPRLAAKLGALVDPGGWAGFLATVSQVTAVAGLLGFGVVLSWLFGREFADGTITGLFALPTGRGTIAVAKLLVYVLWALVVSVLLPVVVVLLGMGFGLGAPESSSWAPFGVQLAVTVLTACLALPAAWAATLGRGLLGGIGCVIGVVVIAQIAALGGLGAWFPFAAPGLWAAGVPVSWVQLLLVLPVVLLFGALTVIAWRRLELDR